MLDIIETKYVFRHLYLFENVYVLFRHRHLDGVYIYLCLVDLDCGSESHKQA
jgi:hypothetical protein